MVSNKNVTFDEKTTEEAPCPKFVEPEGMTNIDLRRLSAIQSKLFETTKTDSRCRRKLCKVLIFITLISLACTFLIMVLPSNGSYTIKSAWNKITGSEKHIQVSDYDSEFDSTNDLTTIIELYMDKLQMCKVTKTFQDCCVIFSELNKQISLNDCTVERVINSILVHEKDLLNQYSEFIKESFNVINNPVGILQDTENYDEYDGYDLLADEDIEDAVKVDLEFQPIEFSEELLYDTVPIVDVTNDTSKRDIIKIKEITPQTISKDLLNSYLEKIRIISRKSPFRSTSSIQIIGTPKLDSKEYKDFEVDLTDTDVSISNSLSKSKRETAAHNLKTSRSSSLDQVGTGSNYDCSQNNNMGQRQCIATYNPQVSSSMPIMQQQLPVTQIIRTPNIPFIISQPQYTYVAPNIQQTLPQPYPNLYGSTPNANPFQITSPTGQYYVCNIVPATNSNNMASSSGIIAGLPGVEVRTANSGIPFQILGSRHKLYDENDDDNTTNNKARASRGCPYGEEMCLDRSKCIHSRFICDSQVHCPDASDEAFCDCKMRLEPRRLCDGYTDCPNGEDEIGCFGCEADMFNCDDWSRVRDATCIPIENRCDGVRQCPTGKDELDCSVLTTSLGISDQLYTFSNNIGFLHRNYKGKWFPACSNTELWATQACYGETGPSRIPPLTHMVPVDLEYDGPYLNADPSGDHEIVPFCVEDHAVYVECPQPTCGLRKRLRNPYRPEEIDTSQEEVMDRFRGRRETENITNVLGASRVVGGKACQPAAWPWVISIYRNGIFHCGGVLISESWLLTAAHCVTKYWQFYYEVEAGMLRRFSYSPMEQIKFISHVVPHEKYDREKLKNDIALMKLNKPVVYNRYVKPVCLPTEITAGRSYDQGPPAGTVCTAVGWGAIMEHGNDPDQLREVEVPILPSCKHKEDSDGNEICAGLMEGGKDACQGDSGGPFMCRNPNFPEQWYVAGIVSHGEGCARPNEPGVYTKVGLYLSWIHESAKDDHLPARTPLHKCPGYTCQETGRCISKKRFCDKLIDCLNGDDEKNCEQSPSVISNLMNHVRRHRPMLLGSVAENVTKDSSAEHEQPKIPSDANNSNAEAHSMAIKHTITSSSDTAGFSAATTSGQHLNPSESGHNESSYIDVSFATSRPISDRNQSISNSKDSSVTAATVANDDQRISSDNSQRAFVESQRLFENATGIVHAPTSAQSDSDNATQNRILLASEKMMERIPAGLRCDKVIDCQDGSDEADCICMEYLKFRHPKTICDGITDCEDLSDEFDCDKCLPTEFYCRRSRVCIPLEQRCNNILDCPLKEDERDCVALSEQYDLIVDGDLRPQFSTSGLVAYNYEGTWRPLCGNFTGFGAEIASDVCVSLGFLDYKKFFELEVYDQPIKTIFTQFSTNFTASTDEKCMGLYLKCSNTTVDKHKLGWEDKFNILDEEYAFPWIAAVYNDGDYKCTGVLIKTEWVLTSDKCFPGILQLNHHYVAVLLGAGRRHLNVGGPHEQVRRVVEVRSIPGSDTVVLRLHEIIEFSRYARPTHFERRPDWVRSFETCLAIGMDENFSLKAVRLAAVKNCTTANKRCFKRSDVLHETCQDTFDDAYENYQILESRLESNVWSGCIVCDSGNGYYPAAIFHEARGLCGFNKAKAYTAVEGIKNDVFNTLERSAFVVEPPKCANRGFRCNLGQCISAEQVCDSVPDCRDTDDEIPLFCEIRNADCHLHSNCACSPSEMRCANGQCIPRSKFCDQRDDCGDGSDEPDRCDCISYLQMTDPSKICDGFRNCLDRSDENPKVCHCNRAHFTCKGGRYCIPSDMVCDGYMDCPNGDDEEQCITLQSNDQDPKSGEVLTRTAGVWHSGCFPDHLTTLQLEDICVQLGFNGSSVFYLKPDGVNQTVGRPVLEQFNVVWVHRNRNTKLRLAMRSGRNPFVHFETDADCNKLFIQCL